MKNIIHQKLNLPRYAPVMVLPQAILFPAAILPLFIFEPRYRAMLNLALEHDRMFCVAPMKPEIEEAILAEDFHHIVGLGLVRACRGNEDGTSHLALQGMARVRLTRFIQESPFRVAEISETAVDPDGGQRSSIRHDEAAPGLRETPIGRRFWRRSDMDAQLAGMQDPDILSDIIAHTFLRDPEQRQEVFEEVRTSEQGSSFSWAFSVKSPPTG